MTGRGFWLLMIFLFFPLQGWGLERYRFERALMGTKFVIVCYAEAESAAKEAADEAFLMAEEVNAVASDYDASSELSQLSSRAIHTPIPLSQRLFEMLRESRRLAKLTEGAFDPTLGPLTQLWRESKVSGQLADPSQLAEARTRTGWKNFSLSEKDRTITLHREQMRFDLGGIGKGYATDLMWEVFKARGIRQVIIAAGGDIRLGDPPTGKEGWKVALQCFDKQRLDEVRVLSNTAIATSGDLYQSLEIEGFFYSHIISPQTGQGLQHRVAATVIADDGKTSDAIATASCVVGKVAKARFEKIPGVREIKISLP